MLWEVVAAEFGLRGWKGGWGQAAPEEDGRTSRAPLRSITGPGRGRLGPALLWPWWSVLRKGLAVPWAGVSTQSEGPCCPQVPDGAGISAHHRTVSEGPVYPSGCACPPAWPAPSLCSRMYRETEAQGP